MIELRHVSFAYGETPVLCDLSLRFGAPGAYAILGASGCGKTTLLHLIAGLLTPTQGEILRPADARIAFCFQEDRLLPWYTIGQNVALVASGDKARRTQTARDWLAQVGLAEVIDAYPDALSGGMKRRAALARALAFDAPILLMDEPFRALDAESHDAMRALIAQHARDKLLILVTHDARDAEGLTPIRL